MENNNEKINCRVCENSDLNFWTEKNHYKLYKCDKCHVISAGAVSDISKIYSKDYFIGAKNGFGYVNYDEDKEPMAETFDRFLNIIEKFSAKKGKLLDVGAASGFFMKLAENRGWEVSGVEISDYAATKARERGLKVTTGMIEDWHNNMPVYVITMWDVIEHMFDPARALSAANKLLEDGGLIAINTPDSGSLVAKILGKKWHLLVPPEHLVIFNQKNLSDLLTKQGFEVLLTAKMGKKFTLRYIFKILANWHRQSAFLEWTAKFISDSSLGKLFLPINLRDNSFIIAKKL